MGGTAELIDRTDSIEFLVTENEPEALLAEQSFIKRYRPRFNIRLRDDKSYPYVGVSLDEEFPRVYFTRERHRPNRAYFGPFSSAKRVRETLDLLGKLFQYRTCEGPEPGRRSGVPCLDYYIKRCQAPCVGYIDKEEYRGNIDRDRRLPLRPLQGDRRRPRGEDGGGLRGPGLRARGALPRPPQRGPLDDGAPAGRRRLARQRRPDRRGGRGQRRERAGLPGPRRRARRAAGLLPGGRGRDGGGRSRPGRGRRDLPAPVLRCRAGRARPGDRRARAQGPHGRARRGAVQPARRAGRGPRRVARRPAPPAGAGREEREARARPGQAAPRASPPAAGRDALLAPGGARPRARSGPDRGLRHLEPRRDPHRRLDGRLRGRRAEEVRLPQVQHPRRVRGPTAAGPTTSPRCRRS